MNNRTSCQMNGRMRRFFSVFLMTLSLAGVALAQNSTLRGQVLDERGDAIPNASVTLTSTDGKERKAKSGITGDFSISNVPPGTYTLKSSYQGFQTQTISELKTPYS